ncbi:MAG: hypothetical protein LBN93_09500 [Candidatus Symbiothrix sp.]|nr:hypothetical protein [Candidatus Symbiothrix sp.]
MTSTGDGRHFQDTDSLTAIWQFHLTANNQIRTKNDILNFCQIELGQYASHFDIQSSFQISPKPKEGIIQVIKIQICLPQKKNKDIAYNNILTHFYSRLTQHSPTQFRYLILDSNSHA